MPRYENDHPHTEWHYHNFLRVEGELFDDGGEYQISHANLANRDNVIGEIARLKEENPDEVDAGLYSVESGKRIVVKNRSRSLKLPLTDQARVGTIDLFKRLNPSYVIELENIYG